MKNEEASRIVESLTFRQVKLFGSLVAGVQIGKQAMLSLSRAGALSSSLVALPEVACAFAAAAKRNALGGAQRRF
jgi:hypothetical protein